VGGRLNRKMWEDRFGYNENIPKEIQDIFMWLCQDLLSLQRMWDFYVELFSYEESLALYTDYARTSFSIIEEALRTAMVMAISRLNDPSTQFTNQNLSFQKLVEICQEVPEINNLYEEFDKACKSFEAHRNKRFGHRDLKTTLEYSENLLPGIGKVDVEEILRLAKQFINSIAQHYTRTEYGFISPVIGGAESLKFFFKMGIDSYKNNLRKISSNNY